MTPTGFVQKAFSAHVALSVVNVVAVVGGASILTDIDIARTFAAVVLFVLGAGSGLTLAIRNLDVVLKWALTPALSLATALIASQVVMSVDELAYTPVVAILTGVSAIGILSHLVPSKKKADAK